MSDDAPGRPAEEQDDVPPVLLALRPPRVTYGLIAANVAVFLLESWWGGSEWTPTLYRMGAVAGRATLGTEPWRIFASAFLHIGVVHLLANMIVLYGFGHFLEGVLGPWRVLVLYAVSAAGGGLISTLAHEQRLAAGASGAVWGLMVAQIVLLLRPRVLFQDLAFNVDKWPVLQPLVLNLLISLHPAIDFYGHLGGGLAGGLFMASGLLARDPAERGWRGAALLATALMAASMAAALARGRPWELRAPRLEMRTLPGARIAVPVPRGTEEVAAAEGLRFGSPRRDPLVIECRHEVFPAALTAEQRDAELALLARRMASEELGGLVVREEGPAVVQIGGRPAYHLAVRNARGARSDLWYFMEGRHGLRLEVVQAGDVPERWRSVPSRIAAGVEFQDAR